MPPARAQMLDDAADEACIAAENAAGRKPPKPGSDAERVAFLSDRYLALTSLLPPARPAAPVSRPLIGAAHRDARGHANYCATTS